MGRDRRSFRIGETAGAIEQHIVHRVADTSAAYNQPGSETVGGRVGYAMNNVLFYGTAVSPMAE